MHIFDFEIGCDTSYFDNLYFYTNFILLMFRALPRLIQQSPKSCLSMEHGVVFTNIHFNFTSFLNAENAMATKKGKHKLIQKAFQ